MTRVDHFEKILQSGLILPNPPIPQSDRWKTSRGPEYYPYVRTLGGVSLFDFADFDADAYTEAYPFSSWRQFVPCPRHWTEAVWLEIDRRQVKKNFIGGDELIVSWNSGKHHQHTIMPRIEAAHIGPISVLAISKVLKATAETEIFDELALDLAR